MEWNLQSQNASKLAGRLENLLFLELALIFFLAPAGRFHFDFAGVAFTTGYDAYKLFPFLVVTWIAWRLVSGSRPFPQSPLLLPLFSFFLIAFCASAASSDPYQSFEECLEIGAYLFFYVLLLDLDWRASALRMVGAAFVAGNVYMALIGVLQFCFAPDSIGSVRMNATFDYPNALGVFCLLSLTLMAWLATVNMHRLQRVLIGLAALLVLFCALASKSRATYLGLLLWLLVYIFSGGVRARKWGMFVLVGLLLFGAPFVIDRFNGLLQELHARDEMSRLVIWPFLLDFGVPALPFFGLGLGPVIPDRMSDWITSSVQVYALSRQWHPHNLFFYIVLAMGIPGFLCFCWILRMAFREFRRCPREIGLILRCGLLSYLVHQLFEVHLLLGNIPIVFFTLLAIGDTTS